MNKLSIGAVACLLMVGPILVNQGQARAALPEIETLNEEHKRDVRQAQRVCSAGQPLGFSRRPGRDACIVGEVERFVRNHENPSMLRFHEALPLRYRYDGQRPGNALRYVE
ncbi:MAG: hypothetical protein RLN89_01555 [Parvibaculum sp.]